jgi:DNA-binding HxlR family transcriptional regulator
LPGVPAKTTSAFSTTLRPIDGTALAKFNRPLVLRIRDKATEHGRRFANYVKAVLSIIFGWGVQRDYLKFNPAEGVKDIPRRKGVPEANRTWSDEERHVVLEEVPAHMKPAIALMMFMGLGPKDALTLPRSFYRNGEIATRRSKTGEAVFWPAPAELQAILASAPKHEAISLCGNSDGKPWTESGFRASWRPIRIRLKKAGAIGPRLTMYGLRHTVAVILREVGFDERTIADALGQKSLPRGVGGTREIAPRVLSRELKALAQSGLIARKDYGVVPPKVEYRLTPVGRSFIPVVAQIRDWGARHLRGEELSMAS